MNDFGKELHRAFAVAEECYDCAEFYDGCRAWPESKSFACGRFNRLPNVLPGTCGQMFPPSRVSGRNKEPISDTDAAPEIAKPKPTTRREPVNLDRRCGCGEPLPKSKRLCDSCRAQNRRQTMRGYMRQRRAAPSPSQPISDMPLFTTATHATHASSDDLLLTGLPSGGARSE